MISDITLGQFFPGKSVLHRMDPRTKLIISILYIVAIFLARSITAFAGIALFTLALVIVSGIKLSVIMRAVRPLAFIIIFTCVINIFWRSGETLLLEWWKIKIYTESLIFAACMIVRIIALLIGTSVVLTYTTSPIAITDGMERLLAPLKVIKLPVHEFSMMMSLALRFVPTLIEETEKIVSAQKARGADFSTGSIAKRAKALIPILVPLFVSAIRRADELATAMECRCYHGGKGRTRMNVTKMKAVDYAGIFIVILFGTALVMLNNYFPVLDVIR